MNLSLFKEKHERIFNSLKLIKRQEKRYSKLEYEVFKGFAIGLGMFGLSTVMLLFTLMALYMGKDVKDTLMFEVGVNIVSFFIWRMSAKWSNKIDKILEANGRALKETITDDFIQDLFLMGNRIIDKDAFEIEFKKLLLEIKEEKVYVNGVLEMINKLLEKIEKGDKESIVDKLIESLKEKNQNTNVVPNFEKENFRI